jgi:dTDP-4-dehydrorhamnose reductase
LPEARKTRVLVLGERGQLATALTRIERADVLVTAIGRPGLDLEDAASIRSAIALHMPDVVVNAAAFTAVDRAESEPQAAFSVNATGAGYAATAVREAGAPIIHISTDYVFPGSKRSPYEERDETGPLNVYGRSKREGEGAVAAGNPAHVILRTGWLYAPWGANFARTMMRLAMERDVVRVVDDQFGTPTYVPHLAEIILQIAVASSKGSGPQGLFHIAAPGETTWAGFAERLFEASARQGGPTARVERITTAGYPTPAPRPAYSVLSAAKLRDMFGLCLPHWQTGVDDFVKAILPGSPEVGSAPLAVD